MQICNPKSINNCRFAIDISDIYHYTEYMFDGEVNMEINITINERITDLRTMSGLSQKELLSRSGMADLDEAETMFYELFKHILERAVHRVVS